MALQPINIGAAPNDKTGDPLRNAFGKANANFADLDNRKVDKVAGKGLSSNDFTNAERVKLANISDAATKNRPDAELLSRANHSGTQTLATISDAKSAAGMDVVGPIATSIIERGTNAAGNYVRFHDGTQICWRRYLQDAIVPPGQAVAISLNFAAAFVGPFSISGQVVFFESAGADGLALYGQMFSYLVGTQTSISALNTGNRPSETFPSSTIGVHTAQSAVFDLMAVGVYK